MHFLPVEAPGAYDLGGGGGCTCDWMMFLTSRPPEMVHATLGDSCGNDGVSPCLCPSDLLNQQQVALA